MAAELLLANVLKCPRIQLYTRFDQPLVEPLLSQFREAVKKAADHYPIAYLLGVKEFYSLEFAVSPAVLIPRPETETLVDQVLAYTRTRETASLSIMDFGTGSGCIGLALAKHLPQAMVIGVEVSSEAAAIATLNARRLQLTERFQVQLQDQLAAAAPQVQYDIIVSNPPYVSRVDYEQLPRTVREYEPAVALCGGGEGLDYYHLIAQQAPACLHPNGAVFVEIGAGQQEAVIAIFQQDGAFRHVQSWRDHREGHWRVVQFAQNS